MNHWIVVDQFGNSLAGPADKIFCENVAKGIPNSSVVYKG